MNSVSKIIYCHCAYAKIIDENKKMEVLKELAQIEQSVDFVPDLCEMSAKNDPKLKEIFDDTPTCVIACYKRSVKWLLHNRDVKWNEDHYQVLNMREDTADEIISKIKSPS